MSNAFIVRTGNVTKNYVDTNLNNKVDDKFLEFYKAILLENEKDKDSFQEVTDEWKQENEYKDGFID